MLPELPPEHDFFRHNANFRTLLERCLRESQDTSFEFSVIFGVYPLLFLLVEIAVRFLDLELNFREKLACYHKFGLYKGSSINYVTIRGSPQDAVRQRLYDHPGRLVVMASDGPS